ncbi:hypothetical protein M514_09041 [Trichuris suis]|uniref:Uncharacterized protein n=1 Tax=Trichuris suis TaxID=68888 RepID=A0A085LYN5_9BILA|nr:hypothetical protein M513_09041 [Trichuris suis]KFD62556.1 hypothetical protein M514_09041 [Trichuris suis]
MRIDGVNRRVLVDSGCTSCIVHATCYHQWKRQRTTLRTISGDVLRCAGIGTVRMEPCERHTVVVDVIVLRRRVCCKCNTAPWRNASGRHGRERFNLPSGPICAAADAKIRVEGADFVAMYDPALQGWTAAWKWANGNALTVLRNTLEEYLPTAAARAAYEEELRTWIQNGWLIPYDERRLGPAKALIPLMAVVQRTKGKVRPVLDFRELNTHIDTLSE